MNSDNNPVSRKFWDYMVDDAALVAIEYAELYKLSTLAVDELKRMWQDAVANRDLVAAFAVDAELNQRGAAGQGDSVK